MGILDQVMRMKDQGLSEEDIIRELQEQRINPKAINDALNQLKIKSAVSDEETEGEIQPSNNYNDQEIYVPSPMPQNIPKPKTQEIQTPQTSPEYAEQYQDQNQDQENYQQDYYQPQPQNQDYSYSESQYAPYYNQGYAYAPEVSGAPVTDTGSYSDSIIEISEQVFSEKIKKIQNQIDNLNEFKTLAETKIEHISKDLKKIENIIDKLQIAILEKIGSYGKNLESIKKEMSMMQDSFSKTLPKMLEKSEKKHVTHYTPTTHKTHKTPIHKKIKKTSKK